MVFTSVYEMFDPLTTVRKQRFWDWFSGDDLKAYWTKTDVTGTGTFAMADEVDGGFSIKTGTSSGNKSEIDFNNKRQYEETGSVFIGVVKRVTGTSSNVNFGATSNITGTATDRGFIENNSGQTFYRLLTCDASTQTATATDTSVDTSFHVHGITFGSSNVINTIDGVTKVTKTTNRPTIPMQPWLFNQTSTTALTESRIRYMECYNT